MKYLMIIALFLISCSKDEDCRTCYETLRIFNTSSPSTVIDTKFEDCKNIVRDEDRTYVEGGVTKRKVVRCY